MWIAAAICALLLIPLACLGIALRWLGIFEAAAPSDEIVAAPLRRPLGRRVRELILLRRDATLRLK